MSEHFEQRPAIAFTSKHGNAVAVRVAQVLHSNPPNTAEIVRYTRALPNLGADEYPLDHQIAIAACADPTLLRRLTTGLNWTSGNSLDGHDRTPAHIYVSHRRSTPATIQQSLIAKVHYDPRKRDKFGDTVRDLALRRDAAMVNAVDEAIKACDEGGAAHRQVNRAVTQPSLPF